jgi:hypothetical protein
VVFFDLTKDKNHLLCLLSGRHQYADEGIPPEAIIEPFRVRSVGPNGFTTTGEREQTLEVAGYNQFQLHPKASQGCAIMHTRDESRDGVEDFVPLQNPSPVSSSFLLSLQSVHGCPRHSHEFFYLLIRTRSLVGGGPYGE